MPLMTQMSFSEFADVPTEAQIYVGKFLKAYNKDKEAFLRGEVVDMTNFSEKKPVKVHFNGTKKSKDEWVALTDLRMGKRFKIDWEAVDEKLPLGLDPQSRETRKALLYEWDGNRKKTLSLKELYKGVGSLFGVNVGPDMEEMNACVKCAWETSRRLAVVKRRKKSQSKLVDAKEFHAFLRSFRHYLELAELFETMDSKFEDDQKLSYRECSKCLEELASWGVDNQALLDFFEVSSGENDSWTPDKKFKEFAAYCIESRFANKEWELDESDSEEVQRLQALSDVRGASGIEGEDSNDEAKAKVKGTFKEWSGDESHIPLETLLQVVAKLNPKLKEGVMHEVLTKADLNKDGVIDYDELCHWLFET